MRGKALIFAGAAILLAAPLDLLAQGRGNDARRNRGDIVRGQDGRSDDDSRDDDSRDRRRGRDRVVDRRDDGRQVIFRDGRVIVIDDRDRRLAARRGKGPAFCRSGAGHPVFGRRWCVQKGFGLGREVRDDRRVIWDDDDVVILRDGRRVRVDRRLSERSTIDRVLDTIRFWSDD